MAKNLVLAGILLSIAAVQVSGRSDSLKKEFFRRSNLVLSLSKMYREYEEVHKSQGANESQPLLEEFVSRFERQFDRSDKWLYEAIIAEDGILDRMIKENGYHYRKTEEFLRFSKKIVNTALDMNHMYRSHQGNLTEVKKIEHFRQYASIQMDKVTRKTLDFIKNEAWKDQFLLDIDSIVRSQGRNTHSLHFTVLTMLVEKYPFRSWFVMIRGADYADNYICPLNDEPAYEEFIGTNRQRKLVVVQVDRSYRQDGNYARMVMNNIATDLKYWTCKRNAAEEIHSESRYSCRSQRLTMFAILDVKRGITPQFTSSEPLLVLSKVVTRSTWMGYCNTRYQVVLFA